MRQVLLCLFLLVVQTAGASPVPAELPAEIQAARNVQRLLDHRDQIVGLELIVASAEANGPIYSQWGHAMLHFVMANGDWTNDPILSFEAIIPSGDPSVLKGLFGGYSIVPDVENFGDYWKRYVQDEERPLKRTVIVSTPEMRDALLDTLSHWTEHPVRYLSDYTFLDRNCAGMLENLFEAAGFPEVGPEVIIPSHLPDYFWGAYLDPYPKLEMRPPLSILKKAAHVLGIPEKEMMNGDSWPPDAGSLLSAALDDLEIKTVLENCVRMPFAVREALVQDHRYDNGGATLNQVLGYQSLPIDFYQPCAIWSCARQVALTARELWPEEVLNRTRRRLAAADQVILHPMRQSVRYIGKVTLTRMVPVERGPLSPIEINTVLIYDAWSSSGY